MLLMPNRKKIAAIIVGGLKGGSKQPSFVQKLGEDGGGPEYKTPEEDDDGGEAMGLEAAMEDFIAGVEAKDAKAMAAAFRHAMTLCEPTEVD